MNHVVFRESRSLLLSNKDSYVRFGAHKKVVSRNRKSPVKNGVISTSPGFLNYLCDFMGAREPIRNATGGPVAGEEGNFRSSPAGNWIGGGQRVIYLVDCEKVLYFLP